MCRLISTVFVVAIGLSSPYTVSARPLQQVLNEGTLRIGVVLFAPWATRSADGELIGFEIDVANRLAEDMGVEPNILIYDFDRLIPALEAGEIDIIAAGLSITPERALHINFSQPYATSGVTLATNLSNTVTVERLTDLDDAKYKLAVVVNTVAVELAGRLLPRIELIEFETAEAAGAALVAGEADAYLDDEPVPTFLALENPTTVDVPITAPLLETKAGFAVNKGDPDFLAFLGAWITAKEADTWLPTRYSYWFKSLRWRQRLERQSGR